MTVLAHGPKIPEASFLHLQHRVFNSMELVLDIWILSRKIAQGTEDVYSLVFFTFKDEPSRRLGEFQNKGKDNESKEDLKRDRKPPCYRARV